MGTCFIVVASPPGQPLLPSSQRFDAAVAWLLKNEYVYEIVETG